jgi:hypothetical protein
MPLDRFATRADTSCVKTSSGGRYDATDAAGRAHRRCKHSGFGVAANTRMTLSGAAYRAASVRHGPPWPLPTTAFRSPKHLTLMVTGANALGMLHHRHRMSHPVHGGPRPCIVEPIRCSDLSAPPGLPTADEATLLRQNAVRVSPLPVFASLCALSARNGGSGSFTNRHLSIWTYPDDRCRRRLHTPTH